MRVRSIQKDDDCRYRPLRFIGLVFVATMGINVWFVFELTTSSPVGGSKDKHSFMSELDTSTVVQEIQPSNSPYAIPRTLIFTHYKNLLSADESSFDEEERALAENVRHSIEVHTDSSPRVLFWTDDECIESLRRVYPSLISFFQNETEGMFKADICRGAALYENGGFYLDVDIGVRHSLWLDLKPITEFVTARVHQQSNYPGHFFQAILGAKPRSPVLFRYLRLFEKHYTGANRVTKGPLGVILLKRAWDYVSEKDSSIRSKTELYQEVLFNRKLFPRLHPAPTWGSRRACHFVVIATVNYDENVEVTIQAKKDRESMKFQIPLVSRIPGSRICPDEVDGKKQNTKWWTRE
jgi:Glycosyltransferase sugar-binding region containing DXD motif